MPPARLELRLTGVRAGPLRGRILASVVRHPTVIATREQDEVNGSTNDPTAAAPPAAPTAHEHAGLRYLVAAPPPGSAGERPTPVLCFLHGYDEGPPAELLAGLTRHGPLRPGNPPSAVQKFIHLAPQLPARGDLWHLEHERVREVVAGVQRRYGGDPRRTYLTGFSFGGNGAFDLGIAQPEIWAALWSVDPTRVPTVDPGVPTWLSIGQAARYRKSGFIRALGLEPYTGDGAGDRLYLDEGADHVGSATSAYADPRIYAWLLSKELRR